MEIRKPEHYDKKWGSEDWIVNRKYCGKIMVLEKGFRCSIHYHKNKDETFYLLEGKMLIELEGEKAVMKPGDVITIEPGQKHRFTGLETCKFIEFSTHHEEEDSYRDTQSGEVDLNELDLEGL